jgi:hypothetical protein
MKAAIGDRIVLASNQVDRPVRDGRIIDLRNPDGSPPYVVEWSDSRQQALVFPGPDAHIEAPGDGERAAPAPVRGQARRWRVEVDIFESGNDTSAHAVLTAEVGAADGAGAIDGHGEAHRRPGDRAVPEIGDELAVARALHRLADRLLATAAADIGAQEGHTVTVRS